MIIGFIGLGNIGGGAASNLVAAGYDVRVADLDERRVVALVEKGALAPGSAQLAAAGAGVVFTSVPGPPQLELLAFGDGGGDGGVLGALRPGSVWVDLSTNDLPTAARIRQAAESHGVRFIDAPVSGGPEGAAAGTLSIFVGGEPDTVELVRPLLQVIGGKVDHVGPPGAGIVAKIAQVTLCYTQTVALIEALLLGVKGGVDPDTMLDLVQHSAGRSYVSEVYGPEILDGGYDESFPIGHAAKDMRLAVELAGSVGAVLPFIESVQGLYDEAEQVFGSGAPHLLAARLVEQRNGLVLHERRSEDPR